MKKILLILALVTLVAAEKNINGFYIPQKGDSATATRNWANSVDTLLTAYATQVDSTRANFTIRSRGDLNAVNFNMYGNNDKTDDVNHINFYRSIGTYAAPGAVRAYGALVGSADDFFNIRSLGWDGTQYALGSEIAVVPNQDWTDTGRGCNFQIHITPEGTTTMSERFRVDGLGVYAIGNDFINQTAGSGFKMYSATNSAIGSAAYFYKSRGNITTPLKVLASDPLGQFAFCGHDSTQYAIGAQIIPLASENWSPTSHGSAINFYTVANTTTTPVINTIMYGNSTYFQNPVGIKGVNSGSASLEVNFNKDAQYGLKLRQTKNGNRGTTILDNGMWYINQFSVYDTINGVSMNIYKNRMSVNRSTDTALHSLHVGGGICGDSVKIGSAGTMFKELKIIDGDADTLSITVGAKIFKFLPVANQ